MQTASFWIWTWVTMSISNNDSHYNMSTSSDNQYGMMQTLFIEKVKVTAKKTFQKWAY